jgi:bacterioferritin-associated ferredoxin
MMECDGFRVSVRAPDGYVCACIKVTHADLLAAAARDDGRSLQDLCRFTGAGDACMACRRRLRRYVEDSVAGVRIAESEGMSLQRAG